MRPRREVGRGGGVELWQVEGAAGTCAEISRRPHCTIASAVWGGHPRPSRSSSWWTSRIVRAMSSARTGSKPIASSRSSRQESTLSFNHLAEKARAANPLSVSASEFEELCRLRREVEEL
jgi:hypothetical protein